MSAGMYREPGKKTAFDYMGHGRRAQLACGVWFDSEIPHALHGGVWFDLKTQTPTELAASLVTAFHLL
jgi:phage terminase large subunit-like protein